MATIADLVANVRGQAFKLGLEVADDVRRHPGCLDHDPTQITASFFGDAPPAIGFPRLVDTGS